MDIKQSQKSLPTVEEVTDVGPCFNDISHMLSEMMKQLQQHQTKQDQAADPRETEATTAVSSETRTTATTISSEAITIVTTIKVFIGRLRQKMEQNMKNLAAMCRQNKEYLMVTIEEKVEKV